MRWLAHILSLVFLVGSTIAALPCFCDSTDAHEQAAEAPVSECCAGYVGERTEDRPDHDCPHCATGGCDSLAVADGGSVDLLVTAAMFASVAPPAIVAICGFEPPAGVLRDAGAPGLRGPPGEAPTAAASAPVHLLHSVFRC